MTKQNVEPMIVYVLKRCIKKGISPNKTSDILTNYTLNIQECFVASLDKICLVFKESFFKF